MVLCEFKKKRKKKDQTAVIHLCIKNSIHSFQFLVKRRPYLFVENDADIYRIHLHLFYTKNRSEPSYLIYLDLKSYLLMIWDYERSESLTRVFRKSSESLPKLCWKSAECLPRVFSNSVKSLSKVCQKWKSAAKRLLRV